MRNSYEDLHEIILPFQRPSELFGREFGSNILLLVSGEVLLDLAVVFVGVDVLSTAVHVRFLFT
jgi:hypothetical protein